MTTKNHERHGKRIFCNFFCTRNYLKFTHAKHQILGPRNKNGKNRTKLFSDSKSVSVTFSNVSAGKMAKDPVKSRFFRNLSNFDELYLRAQ